MLWILIGGESDGMIPVQEDFLEEVSSMLKFKEGI